MKPYDTYEIADFLLDDEFVAWVKKPTPESDSFWQQWLRQYPSRATLVQEARYWVTHLVVNEQLPSDTAVRDALAQIQMQLSDDPKPVFVQYGRRWWESGWRIAAAILLILGVGWFALSVKKVNTDVAIRSVNANEIVWRENRTSLAFAVQLPDGSRVVLSPKSRVEFPSHFAVLVRDIKLTGEAFFDVVRQPKQPFIVHAGSVNVKVLGTSFRVRALGENGEVNVAVKSGKVAVSKTIGPNKSDNTAVLLTPNQQVTFSAQDEVFRKALVEAPILVNQQSQEADFVFEETPIAEVFDKLQLAYGVQIDFDRSTLSHCTLTARLANEPMYKKLNMICQAIGGSHETVGTTIVIHATRCDQ